MDEKPTVAFVLSLIAAVLVIGTSLMITVFGGIVTSVIAETHGMMLGRRITLIVMALGIAGLVLGALMLVGAFMINSNSLNRVRTGSVMVIVCSILSLFAGGGLLIGFVLGLVGGILGLVWRPPAERGSSLV
ncbi:MAG: hypothetical protein QXS42_00690 [Zestosphaera sp.]